MRKTVLPLLVLWLCSLTLIAAPISQQQARQNAVQFDKEQMPVITFETVNKPVGWADLKVTKGLYIHNGKKVVIK
jgi:hypothetical protein